MMHEVSRLNHPNQTLQEHKSFPCHAKFKGRNQALLLSSIVPFPAMKKEEDGEGEGEGEERKRKAEAFYLPLDTREMTVFKDH